MAPSTRLTLKQGRFALEYVRNGGNASAAYRFAYDCNASSVATICRRAVELTSDSNIKARIEELEVAYVTAANLTPETVLAELEDGRQLAKSNKQASAAITATVYKGKHIGMWPNRVEHTGQVDHRLTIQVLDGLSRDEIRQLAHAALERRKLGEGPALEGKYREVSGAPEQSSPPS